MLNQEAIRELAEAQSISAATAALDDRDGTTIALPSHYTLHDLERFAHARRRLRGKMTTTDLADFAAYVQTQSEAGATVFVAQMAAVAVLNMGTTECPGHADNTATFAPQRTAAFSALLGAADGKGRSQQAAAEFLEDWLSMSAIEFRAGSEPIAAAKAIAAVRAITIESARKVESTEQSLGATRSAFESIQASSKSTLPETINFTCAPHLGLSVRRFTLRLGVITGDKLQVVLRIVNLEQHQEDMAAELAQKVRAAVGDVPVVLGEYKVVA